MICNSAVIHAEPFDFAQESLVEAIKLFHWILARIYVIWCQFLYLK